MIRCGNYCIVSSWDRAGNAVHRSDLEDVAANGVLGADSSRFFCMRRLHAQASGTVLASWCAYKSRRVKQQNTRSHATPTVRYVITSVLDLALAVREPVDTVDLGYVFAGANLDCTWNSIYQLSRDGHVLMHVLHERLTSYNDEPLAVEWPLIKS